MAVRALWVASVTQGGADAFAQAQFSTGLLGLTDRGALIREILFEVPRVNVAAALNVELALTRYSKAAMPNITDNDLLMKRKMGSDLVTSGVNSFDLVARYTFTEDDNLIVIEDPIFFQIDSNATTLTQSAFVRVAYELVRVPTDDRIALLQLGLS